MFFKAWHENIAEPEPPYPGLMEAFLKAVKQEMNRLHLTDNLRLQVTSHKGAAVKFHVQGQRHELSLNRLIGTPGHLRAFSVVVRQNNMNQEPYRFGEKAAVPKWNRDRRSKKDERQPLLSEPNFYPT
jgi:hypothetical protein